MVSRGCRGCWAAEVAAAGCASGKGVLYGTQMGCDAEHLRCTLNVWPCRSPSIRTLCLPSSVSVINLLVSLLGDRYGQPSNQLVSLYSSRNCDLFSNQRRPSYLYKFNSSGETIVKGKQGHRRYHIAWPTWFGIARYPEDIAS